MELPDFKDIVELVFATLLLIGFRWQVVPTVSPNKKAPAGRAGLVR